MAKNVSNLTLNELRKLKGLKEQYAIGGGTENEELQSQASVAADELRKSAGITAGSAGQYSLPELNKIIAGRLPETRQDDRTTDPGAMQRRLAEQQERAQIAGLTRAKEAGLSALTAEEERLTPAYAGARSGVRATSERGAQQFAEFLAQRGLARGGGAALGETQRLGAMQGALGGLREQETAAVGDIARRRTGLEAGFASDVEAARAGIQAQALQRQMAGQQTAEAARVQAQQQAFQNALSVAGLTGQYEGAPTLAGQSAELARQAAIRRTVPSTAPTAVQPGLAPIQTIANVNRIRDAFQSIKGVDPIQYLASNYATLTQQYGKDAVDQFAEELYASTQPAQAIPTEPITVSGYKTNPDFAKDLSTIINATPETRELIRARIQSDIQGTIAKYGLDGYKALVAKLDDMLYER